MKTTHFNDTKKTETITKVPEVIKKKEIKKTETKTRNFKNQK